MHSRRTQIKQTTIFLKQKPKQLKHKPIHSHSHTKQKPPINISQKNPQIFIMKWTQFLQKYHMYKQMGTINNSLSGVHMNLRKKKQEMVIQDVPYILSEQISVDEKFYQHEGDANIADSVIIHEHNESINICLSNKQDQKMINNLNTSTTKNKYPNNNPHTKLKQTKRQKQKEPQKNSIKITDSQKNTHKSIQKQKQKQKSNTKLVDTNTNQNKIVISIQLNQNQYQNQQECEINGNVFGECDSQNFTDDQDNQEKYNYIFERDCQDQLQSTNKNSKIQYSNCHQLDDRFNCNNNNNNVEDSVQVNQLLKKTAYFSFPSNQQKQPQSITPYNKNESRPRKQQDQQNYNHLNKQLKSKKVQVLLKFQNEQQTKKEGRRKIIKQDREFLTKIINKIQK